MSDIIHYFSGCCGGLEPFAIASATTTPSWSGFEQIIGKSYGLVIGFYSGCVGYSGSSTTNLGYSFKVGTPYFYPYESCSFCTKWIYPCYTPPVVIPPTIVGYKNECGIVTILPMGIQCVTSNATTSDSFDGEISLEITGGTPPYTTTWTWGNNNSIESPAIGGIGNGSYSATTVDYWGDFTATTVCYLNTEPDCTFNVTVVEQDINNCLPTAMSGYTFDLT
jgi:hypothetical protein